MSTVELGGAPVLLSTLRQEQFSQLMIEGKSVKEARAILEAAPHTKEVEARAARAEAERRNAAYAAFASRSLTARQRQVVKGAAGRTKACHPAHCSMPTILCSLPRGHKGPHVLLFTR